MRSREYRILEHTFAFPFTFRDCFLNSAFLKSPKEFHDNFEICIITTRESAEVIVVLVQCNRV